MRFTFLLLIIAVALMVACESDQHRLQGTDIPRVPETTVESNTLELHGRRAISGTVRFVGPIYDALERVRWTARGFDLDGWKEVSLTGTPAEANALFVSEWHEPGTERVAKLHIVASHVRGQAILTIEVKPAPEDDKKDGSDAKDSAG